METQEREDTPSPQPTRRTFLQMCLALPAPLLLAACGSPAASSATPKAGAAAQPTSAPPTQAAPSKSQPAPSLAPPTQAAPVQQPTQPAAAKAAPSLAAQAKALPPTPACTDADDVTPSQTEGPFFTRHSPERASLLESGVTGTKLVVSGYVLTTDCKPVARALLDFWQADDKGQYDNTGFRLRGHQFTDDAGRYALETVVPGLYPGRTRHLHVKVQAANRPVLTSQLYFPGETRNQNDGIFNRELVMDVQDASDGKVARFDFVVRVS